VLETTRTLQTNCCMVEAGLDWRDDSGFGLLLVI
jgi:hypothetical protein